MSQLTVGKYYSHDTLIGMGFELVCENFLYTVGVYKFNNMYYVFNQNICRHPDIDAEGAMRALVTYVQ